MEQELREVNLFIDRIEKHLAIAANTPLNCQGPDGMDLSKLDTLELSIFKDKKNKVNWEPEVVFIFKRTSPFLDEKPMYDLVGYEYYDR